MFMDVVLFIARLLLAAVFFVAGFAKLADLPGSRQALRDFGVPAVLANPSGVLLPLAEIAVAVALIPSASAWWGALGALALLLLFVAGISYNLARGRTPDCHCFGQIHSSPAGWPTLIRNLLLAAIAGFVVGFGRTNAGPDVLSWFTSLAVAQRIELVAGVIVVALLALESWVLFQAMKQQGRLLLRLEVLEARLGGAGIASLSESAGDTAFRGLPVGSQAPTFSLSGLHGETITLDALRAPGKPIVLVFSDPGCGPCIALLPEAGRWQRDYASKLILVVISRGTPEDNRAKTAGSGITQVLLQQDREVAESYQVAGTPSAVLIRTDGTIATPLAEGADNIRGLVAGAIGLPVLRSLPISAALQGNGGAALSAQPTGQKVGERAPEFTLPDLSGKQVSLADFRGDPTLALFWNPGCGFCQRMLDDLKAWEAKPSEGAPRLLVVSTGSVEENKAMGLRSPVLLDQGFSVGNLFGANGTPMAVLVDAEGNIASEVAAGAPDVLALARSSKDPARS